MTHILLTIAVIIGAIALCIMTVVEIRKYRLMVRKIEQERIRREAMRAWLIANEAKFANRNNSDFERVHWIEK